MANKQIFNTLSNRGRAVAPANTVNQAGGKAYSQTSESDLAQYVVTGTSNGTYYAGASEQVDTVLKLAENCSSEFIAKAVVYGHAVAKMKDIPALLCCVLAARGEEGVQLLEVVFPQVIRNQKMLRNFVQILRSGKTGRKSFGTAVKRMIRNWLANQEGDQLFYQSVGNDPSLADIIKMVHPCPESAQKKNFYAWLIGKPHQHRYLPPLLKQFEDYKAGKTKEVPAVDFRMLTALNLGTAEWTEIALKASWNQLRMNLNTFQRHGVLDDRKVLRELAAKLSDADAVHKSCVFPYQLMTAFQATQGQIPVELSIALQQALEVATDNVPKLNGDVAICVDTSGSMQNPVTGVRAGATTKTMCIDVAGLIASCIVRKNPSSTVVPFDTQVHLVQFNPLDSVLTNAQKFARRGGGTNCAAALEYLNSQNWKGAAVIYVSDNESWFDKNTRGYGYYGRGTSMAQEWSHCASRNPRSKLICIDLVPNRTVQVPDDKNVLNVGGFTDSVFEVVANFVNGDSRNFEKVIYDS